MQEFFPGQSVSYREHSGYVNFISEKYITICIKEYCKPTEDLECCKRNSTQVNLLVFPEYWHEVVDNSKWVMYSFPQKMRRLWKTLSKLVCVFYLSINVSVNCTLSTLPNRCQPLWNTSEILTSPLLIIRLWVSLTAPWQCIRNMVQ